MRVESFFMLQNKTSKQKCLSFLPESAFSSNSVAILECAEEDKQIYQIVGKQDVSRTQWYKDGTDQTAVALCKKNVKISQVRWVRFKVILSIKTMKEKKLEGKGV